MSEFRSTIQFNDHSLEVMSRAEGLWPEFQGNRSALIRKILADWDHIRNEKGGRTERLEKRMNEHDRLLKLICSRLDIDTGDNHDVDPA